jgi:DNA invertase Pin-like site-specific DNA recombinase
MTTAIYIRVSTNKQQNGAESQRLALESYLKDPNNLVYEDIGISGTKRHREGLESLLESVKDGSISKVVVYSFSRMARSTKHLIEILELFDKYNVAFVSITENVDTTTPMGRMVFRIMASLAEFERDLISERTKAGLENARAKGRILGARKTRPSLKIRKLRNQGYSYRDIAKRCGVSLGTVANELKRS